MARMTAAICMNFEKIKWRTSHFYVFFQETLATKSNDLLYLQDSFIKQQKIVTYFRAGCHLQH